MNIAVIACLYVLVSGKPQVCLLINLFLVDRNAEKARHFLLLQLMQKFGDFKTCVCNFQENGYNLLDMLFGPSIRDKLSGWGVIRHNLGVKMNNKHKYYSGLRSSLNIFFLFNFTFHAIFFFFDPTISYTVILFCPSKTVSRVHSVKIMELVLCA